MTVLLLAEIGDEQLAHKEALERAGFRVIFPPSEVEGRRIISTRGYTTAVLCYSLSSESAEEFAELIRQACPECPVITVSQAGVEDRKVDADIRVALTDGPAALVRAVGQAATLVSARERNIEMETKRVGH
jgi:DNA-binding response OmpR family regulator